MRVALASIGLAAVLTACQTASYQGNVNSPYYLVPAGSRLTLTRELTFDPDQLSVYVQNGHVLPFSRLQVYSPFCKFELYKKQETQRVVNPDQIEITRTLRYRTEGEFARNGPPPRVQVATVAWVAQLSGDQSPGGSPLYSSVVRMDLRSQKQPDIFRMSCARWFYPGMDKDLTVPQMRQTLSPLFTLRLPSDG